MPTLAAARSPLRICLVYDCLFPHTVGGAERWYANLGERLAREGHEVTYLTLRQWEGRAAPGPPGVKVLAVGPSMELYAGGRRRVLPPLAFGLGVAWHLLRHGSYDVVHTASFPYFPLLAAAAVRPLRRFRLVVDWHEVWSRAYWRRYLGPAGVIGWWIQRLCARVPQLAFCFSRLHAARLSEIGLGGAPTLLEGEYAGSLELPRPEPPDPVVLFAGRHVPEKRVPALVRAVATVREVLPELTCDIYGDGPERPRVEALVSELGLADAVWLHGIVTDKVLERALRRALCMVLPSRREGYGLIVVEASALGVPSIVAAGEDNAAVELVEDGENGVVAASGAPRDLAAAILEVHAAGDALRQSTAAWFDRNARRLSLGGSVERLLACYSGDEGRQP
jgi:glycosyltransferase involved in cell wall biosynthesis